MKSSISIDCTECPEGLHHTPVSYTHLAGEHNGATVSLSDIATASMCGNDMALTVTNTHTSPISPPPYMVGAAEVEVCLLYTSVVLFLSLEP